MLCVLEPSVSSDRTRDLQQQLAPLLETFYSRKPILPGSLYTLRRRCGKPSCHRASDSCQHRPGLPWPGRSANLTPTPEQLPTVRQLQPCRRFRKTRLNSSASNARSSQPSTASRI